MSRSRAEEIYRFLRYSCDSFLMNTSKTVKTSQQRGVNHNPGSSSSFMLCISLSSFIFPLLFAFLLIGLYFPYRSSFAVPCFQSHQGPLLRQCAVCSLYERRASGYWFKGNTTQHSFRFLDIRHTICFMLYFFLYIYI